MFGKTLYKLSPRFPFEGCKNRGTLSGSPPPVPMDSGVEHNPTDSKSDVQASTLGWHTLDEDEVFEWFSSKTFRLGEKYLADDRVHILSLGPDEARAKVAGSARTPYQVEIGIRQNAARNRTYFHSKCSCPTGIWCKHAVATLLAAQERWDPSGPQTTTDLGTSFEEQRWKEWLANFQPKIVPAFEGPPPPTPTPAALGVDDEPDEPSDLRVHYILQTERDTEGEVCLRISLHLTGPKKRGGWKKGRKLSVSVFRWGPGPAQATPADRQIIRLADDETSALRDLRLRFGQTDAGDALRLILTTGRAHWGSLDGPWIELGPSIDGSFFWELDATLSQSLRVRPRGASGPSTLEVLDLGDFWYIDEARGKIGPLDFQLDATTVRHLHAAPVLMPNVSDQIAERFAAFTDYVPRPRSFEVKGEPVSAVPRLHITLFGLANRDFARELPSAHARMFPVQPAARVQFNYDGHLMSPNTPQEEHGRSYAPAEDGSGFHVVIRDQEEEEEWSHLISTARLLHVGGLSWNKGREEQYGELRFVAPAPAPGSDEKAYRDWVGAWLRWTEHQKPQLEGAGVVFKTERSFPLQVVEPDDKWVLESLPVKPATKSAWLGFDVGIEVDGQRMGLGAILASYLAGLGENWREELRLTLGRKEPVYLPIEGGRILRIDGERFAAILSHLVSFFNPKTEAFEPTLPELAGLVAADSEQLFLASEDIAGIVLRLRELAQTDYTVTAPTALRTQLRDYQARGLGWMQALWRAELSGLLADDMGLGKTVQAIAHILALKEDDALDAPCLVVCPTSVIWNWQSELERFAPNLKTYVHHGSARTKDRTTFAEHDVVISTYPLLFRDDELFLENPFTVAILDEAQFIKNANTKVARTAYNLEARQKLCLTGTPVENHLGELWSQFHYLIPELFGSRSQFGSTFRSPIEKNGDAGATLELQSRIRPFVLRREKEEVERELPPKTELRRYIELSEEERDLYETVRAAMHNRVLDEIKRLGMQKSQIILLDALLKLRQICCDVRLMKSEGKPRKTPGSKLTDTVDLIEELVSAGRRILLFSQFTSMLELVEHELDRHKIEYSKLTGQTRKRKEAIEKFQSGAAPVFLISLKAGGTGLNLTEADTVIHYDPWWNPAAEAQATDRAHRIGQDKKVFVHKLIVRNSVEESILKLQERKLGLAKVVTGTGNKSLSFSLDDVEALLGPSPGTNEGR